MYYYQTILFSSIEKHPLFTVSRTRVRIFCTCDICDTYTLNGFRPRADDGPILVALPDLNPL